jgi:hypothetical protein
MRNENGISKKRKREKVLLAHEPASSESERPRELFCCTKKAAEV